MKHLALLLLISGLSIAAKAQSYTWTNLTNHKITVSFKYDQAVGSGVLLSKEFNPGESFTFNNLAGTMTQAVVTGGKWNGSFTILYMGGCVTCSKPGRYDIK